MTERTSEYDAKTMLSARIMDTKTVSNYMNFAFVILNEVKNLIISTC